MKKIFSLLVLLFTTVCYSGAQNTKSALLIIDIQNFYFKGGRSELVEPVKAAKNAAQLLTEFRLKGLPVIHIRHNSEPGGEIHKLVEPLKGEKTISKNEVNCFVGTDLIDYLRSVNISSLVICGMQTHMCVEAAVRAATDFGFSCILISDACATRDLKYDDKLIKAEDVQFSTLSTLKSYAEIETTAEFLDNKQE
jgi:nicotinamidase-related amidase